MNFEIPNHASPTTYKREPQTRRLRQRSWVTISSKLGTWEIELWVFKVSKQNRSQETEKPGCRVQKAALSPWIFFYCLICKKIIFCRFFFTSLIYLHYWISNLKKHKKIEYLKFWTFIWTKFTKKYLQLNQINWNLKKV